MEVRKHSQLAVHLAKQFALGAAVIGALVTSATAAPKLESTSNQALFAAVYDGNRKAVQDLLSSGADPNAVNAEGTPALFIAALQNDAEIARLLIKYGADVKRVSNLGRTALHVAAATDGAFKIAKMLVDAGADVNAQDKLEGIPVIPVGSGHATPLLEAAKTRDTRTLKLLLDRGADVNAREKNGSTPLMIAAASGNREGVRLLIAARADVDATNKFGSTALPFAVMRDDAEMVCMLLDAGIKVNTVDGAGSSPLMWAAYSEWGNAEIVDLLLKAGADPNVKNKMGETPMTWASRNGETDIVKRLRTAGVADEARIRAVIPQHEPYEVKRAVETALQALQKSGPEFVKKSGCVSCHHQNVPAMATGLARKNGFSYNEQVAAEQQKTVLSRLRPAHAVLLEGADVVPEIPLTGGYMLMGLAAEGYPFDTYVDAAVRAVASKQLPDGSFLAWAPRPPIGSGYIRATAVAARGMALYTPAARKREFEERIARARDYLRTAVPHTTEERTMQLLGLAWTGASREDLDRVGKLLLRQQQEDGGWSQLVTLETDAYATSHALIALHEAGVVKNSDEAWQRGVKYLLSTQFEDGSWLVKTRSFPFQPLVDSYFPHGRDQWISASATGWAAIALQMSQM